MRKTFIGILAATALLAAAPQAVQARPFGHGGYGHGGFGHGGFGGYRGGYGHGGFAHRGYGGYGGYGYRGGGGAAVAAGVLGLVGGLAAGAALASENSYGYAAPAYGYGYAPAYGYVPSPVCRTVRETVYDRAGILRRRVYSVCD
jgi:hypothetical protein